MIETIQSQIVQKGMFHWTISQWKGPSLSLRLQLWPEYYDFSFYIPKWMSIIHLEYESGFFSETLLHGLAHALS